MAMLGSKTLARLTSHMKNDIVTKLAKDIKYTKEGGFILYLQMPADDDSNCEIGKVQWFDPIVTVEVEDSFGQGTDVIRINPVPTRTLWDICSDECKLRFDPREKELQEKRKKREEEEKKKQEAKEATEGKPSENDKALEADDVNPIASIYFSQVTGFFKPDPEKRKGVCRNFLGFCQKLALVDPTQRAKILGDTKRSDKPAVREKTIKWCKENCVVVHHESGSGRTLLCQSGSPELANLVNGFLSEDVKAIAQNCEFLARHLRFEREKIARFIAEAQKMLGGGE